jgi:hypothetical protein
MANPDGRHHAVIERGKPAFAGCVYQGPIRDCCKAASEKINAAVLQTGDDVHGY